MPTSTCRLMRWTILGCLLAQLVLASAPLWHHHHDDGAPDQCSVCVAVHAAQTGDVPALSASPLPARVIEFLTTAPESTVIVAPMGLLLARGPPRSTLL